MSYSRFLYIGSFRLARNTLSLMLCTTRQPWKIIRKLKLKHKRKQKHTYMWYKCLLFSLFSLLYYLWFLCVRRTCTKGYGAFFCMLQHLCGSLCALKFFIRFFWLLIKNSYCLIKIWFILCMLWLSSFIWFTNVLTTFFAFFMYLPPCSNIMNMTDPHATHKDSIRKK